jgi:hypothetical protein
MTSGLGSMCGAGLLALCVTAPAAAQTAAPKRGPVSSEIGGFSIVLVLGETQPAGTTPGQELPAGARKALNDMRDFLPYKNYRVLDSQWISCCSPAPATEVGGRLQGVVNLPGVNGAVNLVTRPFAFSVTASASTMNIPVRFLLSLEEAAGRRPGQAADVSREMERERQDLQAEAETLSLQISNLQARVEIGAASPLDVRPMQDRHAQLLRRIAQLTSEGQILSQSSRPIIDGSFTMDAGETVVVGTSKLGGDKALIALVTAVRKNAGSREE